MNPRRIQLSRPATNCRHCLGMGYRIDHGGFRQPCFHCQAAVLIGMANAQEDKG